jgi:cysteine desulfurase / selenocysteine lyase
MSTNIDQPGFPDTKILEELANRLFKATTIEDQTGAEKELLKYDALQEQGSVSELKKPPVGLTDSYPAPPSAGGAGISPGAINRVNAIDLRNQDRSDYDNFFAGNTNASPSVAGSGISPSAHKQGNEVDLQNPQTALHDPHFANGNVPQSVAGSGSSPSVKYAEKHEPLPLTAEHDLLPDMRNILAGIPSFISVPQIPYGQSEANEASYYFLDDNNHPLNKKTDTKVNGSQADRKTGLAKPPFDVNLIKKDFPILQEQVNGKPLIWLDNAATTQKPKSVIDRVSYFYEHENSNVHRAAHELAARATDAYEGAREKVRRFLNAASVNEIIFVRGTTEAINLVAKTYGDQYLQKGDEIIVSHLEHHANIVPWQQLAQKKGLKLRVIPVDDDGQILLDEYRKLLNPKTKLVSFTQVSNALGTVTPAKQIIDMAHGNGSKVLLDGAQSVSHLRVDLQSLNPDFFVFSGHKIFGPTGIGVVYGKEDLLNSLQPWQGGGNMIKDVTFEHTQFQDAPYRFEAGTGNIADAVGLGAALDYVTKLGIDNINQYEHYLLLYATNLMKQVPGLRLIGTAPDKASVLSFTLKGYSNDEVGKALNKEGIAVRTGHHCAQPILRRFGVESTVRPSLAFYNTCSDIDTLVSVLHQLKAK